MRARKVALKADPMVVAKVAPMVALMVGQKVAPTAGQVAAETHAADVVVSARNAPENVRSAPVIALNVDRANTAAIASRVNRASRGTLHRRLL
jgi:hypothetical protein